MAITRGATWGGKKVGKGTLDYTRSEVVKNLRDDIAELTKAGKVVKLRRIMIENGVTQVKLARGAYEAETVEIDSTDLKAVLADMQDLAADIAAKTYDDVIGPLHDKITKQMSNAQGGRAKVAAWILTLAPDKQDEYSALNTVKVRHEWRTANGYK